MPIPLGVLAVAGAGAAGGGGSFDLLETTLITTNTASVTFSSLGSYSDYKHLQIRATIRANGTTLTGMRLRFNGDTGNNYAHHRLEGNGASVSSNSSGANADNIFLGFRLPGDSDSNNFSALVFDVLDFSSTTKNTTARIMSGYADVNYGFRTYFNSGMWNNTAGVTSITISQGADSFVSGTRLSLYGVK
jgi:hypothetical protein